MSVPPTLLSLQGAGRIQSLCAFRRAYRPYRTITPAAADNCEGVFNALLMPAERYPASPFFRSVLYARKEARKRKQEGLCPILVFFWDTPQSYKQAEADKCRIRNNNRLLSFNLFYYIIFVAFSFTSILILFKSLQ